MTKEPTTTPDWEEEPDTHDDGRGEGSRQTQGFERGRKEGALTFREILLDGDLDFTDGELLAWRKRALVLLLLLLLGRRRLEVLTRGRREELLMKGQLLLLLLFMLLRSILGGVHPLSLRRGGRGKRAKVMVVRGTTGAMTRKDPLVPRSLAPLSSFTMASFPRPRMTAVFKTGKGREEAMGT